MKTNLSTSPARENDKNLFPLRLLFDTPGFAKATRHFPDDILLKIAVLQRRFQEAVIPATLIEFKDREQIAMIFERINRSGVPLDTFQLLTAWTWSNDFDLNERIRNLGAEVDPYGYANIGDQQDLLMKCCSAVVQADASAKALLELHGPTVRDQFDKIRRGIVGAIEFLRLQLNVHSLDIMPYPAMIVPLTKFFATDSVSGFSPTAEQSRQPKRWFWRSCFSRRYSSGVGKAHAADIAAMDALKNDPSVDIAKFNTSILRDFFLENNFSMIAVNTKIFILLLANQQPRSFISNHIVKLDDVLLRCNRNEFHHIFPKNHLKKSGEAETINSLVNFCFISAADNQIIKDKAPQEYVQFIKTDYREDIFERSCLPKEWYTLSYTDFRNRRAEILAQRAQALMS